MKTIETIICPKCKGHFERPMGRNFWFDFLNDRDPDLVYEAMQSKEYKQWVGT